MMAVLAQRNLRRGLALGLPSGQGVANHFGVTALTAAQLQSGLPANEVAVSNDQRRAPAQEDAALVLRSPRGHALHAG